MGHSNSSAKQPLTPKQKKVLDFIEQYTATEGYAPSQKEIANHFGFRSLGTVQNYLVRLERHGFLRKTWNARRSVEVVPSESPSSAQSLPLAGRVAAGYPIEAIEDTETLEVPDSLLTKSGEHFVLLVEGDSMIEDGILNGDYVIVNKKRTANNGETVVALINNEATVKRFYHRKNQVDLEPANPNYPTIRVNPRDNFQIEGIVVGVIRQLG